MMQSEFLARNKRAFDRRQLVFRMLFALRNLLVVIIMLTSAAVFAWTAMSFTPAETAPFSKTMWLSMNLIVAAISFGLAGYFMFATLDELFLSKHDRRRITGKR